MPARRFMQLDVFSDRPMRGNPLAVVIDAHDIDDQAMQAFARWTNLSETTFLLPPTTPQADYRVRIFTPRQELPFAGHPSVGSAYAAIEAGLVDPDKTALVQECAAGLLPVRVAGRGASRIIHVQAPAARSAAVAANDRESLAAALHAALSADDLALVDNGPLWLVCDLKDAAVVRALAPEMGAIASLCERLSAVGVSVFGSERAGDLAMAVRAFCPADGIPEDPVTGSANAAIMAHLAATDDRRYGLHYRASQGREVGRDGIVDMQRDPDTGAISLGGACTLTIQGTLTL